MSILKEKSSAKLARSNPCSFLIIYIESFLKQNRDNCLWAMSLLVYDYRENLLERGNIWE